MIDFRELHQLVERESGYCNRRDYFCNLEKIAFPQSVCPGCGFLGSLLYRQCKCPQEMATVNSLEEYRVLVAALPKPKPEPSRIKETAAARRARRRTKILRARNKKSRGT